MSKPNRKAEVGAATRAQLIATARDLFAGGYEAVGTPAIAEAAGVTRGALYHHFADKKALFAAVVEQVAGEIVDGIDSAATDPGQDPVEAVLAGCREFVSACLSDETRQIFLVDAPAVLGWKVWREIDTRHGLGSLRAGVAACAAAGHLVEEEVDVVAHLISGALNETVFAIAHASGETASSQQFDICLKRLVRGMLGGRPDAGEG